MTQRGTLLGGRYELDQVIGRGGMAEVWRARDTRLARDVAVKRLRIDLASDPTFQARFRKEAQSAAGLNHPNIVAVYDTGEELDTSSQVSVPYIVMELVEGVTLRDVLRDGRKILPERALEFAAGVLDALGYSHRAGIIHRDIKPANVMLTPDGTVKVMDFGIARAVADTSATMTQTAAVIGTAQYLSPEQARGEKVDHRSDLYSAGCLLYELLVSEPPFKGDSPVSVAYQHVREAPVPPSHLDPEVTPDMDTVTLVALAKSADDRYQDAREMRADVLRAMNHEPVHARLHAPVDDATTVMAKDLTSTARRAAVPATPVAVAVADSPVEVEEEEKKSRKPLVILLIIAGLVLAGMVWAIYAVLNPPPLAVETTTVPRVTSLSQDAATNQLLDNDLVPEVEVVAGTSEDAGTVLSQEPEGGVVVDVKTVVIIRISQGPDTQKIPEIVGMTEAKAKEALSGAGFTDVKAVEDDPATEDIAAKAGTVTLSSPQPGADVSPDETVTITIATGQSLVPELVGETKTSVADLAKQAGFDKVTITEVETDEAEPGEVLEQDPEAGTAQLRTNEIKITVAKSVADPAVPTLTGLTEAQARAAANNAGFPNVDVVEVEDNVVPAGQVVAQSPAAGTTSPPATTVTITVAKAVADLAVPNLLGLTEAEAEAAVRAAGFGGTLRVSAVDSADQEPGKVFNQSPDVGTDLSPDGTIEVEIARTP